MYVLPIENIKNENVGKKAKNLRDLIKNDLPVPNGFAITSEAFYDFIEKNMLTERINNIISDLDVNDFDKLRKASENIMELINSKNMPGDIKNEIADAYEDMDISKEAKAVGGVALDLVKIGRGQTNVIVRPSTDKDFSPMHAVFARGLSNLVDAVKKCWSLFYTPEAIFYRRKKGIKDFSIGVVVQKAVDPEKSGNVLINDNIVIEASWGFGEGISNGLVIPDRYILEKDGKILNKRVGKKPWRYVRDLLSNNVVKDSVFSEYINAEVLDDEEIKYIFEISKKFDNSIIEWCKKRDKFYVVDVKRFAKVKETNFSGEVVFKGFGLSSGIASGKVKFISGSDDFERVEKGDIIAVQFLSPVFIPILNKINGVISEYGGLTSNFALVCREFGIPCIAEVDTSIFIENQDITINGYTGEILRVSKG
jgi:pyruvate,water dikinase